MRVSIEQNSSRGMEHKIEESKAASLPSIVDIGEHCLLHILKYLELDDYINVGESGSHLRLVVNVELKKYKTFQLDSNDINKEQMYIDKLFSYIGEHVSSLKCYCFDIHVNFTQILVKISNNFKNLKTLSIHGFEGGASENVPTVYSFDNVEALTLSNCNSDFTKCLLKDFRKLQSVNICGFIKPYDLKMILQNNPNIKNLIVMVETNVFNGELLELIPNVERLCSLLLIPSNINIPLLNSLPKLNRLTKLQLHCQGLNINNLLRELARKEILEEMQLECVAVDNDFFDTLKPLKKLQLMVIVSRPNAPAKLESSIAWPTNLKQLRLTNFILTHNDFIAMIQQLKNVECIDIWGCDIFEDILLGNITKFNDVMTLSLKIRHVIYHSSRKQRLDIILPKSVKPEGVYLSKKYLIDSEQLRILRFTEHGVGYHHEWNPLGISINFPGCVIGAKQLW